MPPRSRRSRNQAGANGGRTQGAEVAAAGAARRADEAPAELPPELAEGVEAFLAFLELEKGSSRNTLDAYERDLHQCADFLSGKGMRGWAEVPTAALSDWLYALTAQGLSVASLARKLSVLRAFFRHLLREGGRSDDPTAMLAGPKLRRRAPDTLNEREVARLLEAPDPTDPHGVRDRAILELAYSSGLRAGELAGLMLTQVDLENGFVRVFGKGSKERIVPVGESARRAIEAYLGAARPTLVRARTGSALFLSDRGGALSRKTIWALVRRHAARAGLEKPVKTHLLRHSFATHLLSGGADLRAIQEMLGHASITTTQIYTAVETRRVLAEHEKFHPRNRRR